MGNSISINVLELLGFYDRNLAPATPPEGTPNNAEPRAAYTPTGALNGGRTNHSPQTGTAELAPLAMQEINHGRNTEARPSGSSNVARTSVVPPLGRTRLVNSVPPRAAGAGTVKRLNTELRTMLTDPPPGCTARVKNQNILEWEATIEGPAETPYAGGVFHLLLRFDRNYPFAAPAVKFTTRIYHCNIVKGFICLDILDHNWSPAFTVPTLLVSIRSLLGDCNPYSPLDINIAREYIFNRIEHDNKAKEHTLRYAMPKDEECKNDKDKKDKDKKDEKHEQ